MGFLPVWPTENWLGSSMNHIRTGLDDCLTMLLPCFRKRMSALFSFSGSILVAASKATPPMAACTVALGSQASATKSRSLVVWGQLYKNRSSGKIDFQRLSSREYDFLKIFFHTENQFSRKTYFYTIRPRPPPSTTKKVTTTRTERATTSTRRP